MKQRSLTALVLAAGLAGSVLPAAPALADGAASTRNILLGGAAAAAGTLIIINHNKQVHAREAAMAQQQADSDAAAQNAQAAYAAEHQAYEHQVAINAEYQREVAIQHNMIVAMRRQLAQQPSGQQPVRVAAARSVSYGWGAL